MTTLNLTDIDTKAKLIESLEIFFSLPDWWGRNWDAFSDCLSDRQISTIPSRIEIIGGDSLKKNCPGEMTILLEILDEHNIQYTILPSRI